MGKWWEKFLQLREFENIVETLEHEAENGDMGGSEIWLVTDSKTVESCLYRGDSWQKKYTN